MTDVEAELAAFCKELMDERTSVRLDPEVADFCQDLLEAIGMVSCQAPANPVLSFCHEFI